jgi:NADPH:quinone reductase-like Zn-dependent oxidoreductase
MTTTTKAVYLSKADGAVVKDVPAGEPELGSNEILIKNVSVGSNPKGEM